jgi:hypothetical protein
MPADRAPGGTSNYVKACFPAYASGSVAGNSPDLPTELNCVAAIAGAPAAFKVPPGTASFDPIHTLLNLLFLRMQRFSAS